MEDNPLKEEEITEPEGQSVDYGKRDSQSEIVKIYPRLKTDDDALFRNNSMPTRKLNSHLDLERGEVSLSRGANPNSAPYLYDTLSYPSKNRPKRTETPGFEAFPITVVNTVLTPSARPGTPGTLGPTDSIRYKTKKTGEVKNIELRKPFQFRAFSRRAVSYQKRQWFENICCITLCPFIMIILAFLLKIIIAEYSDGSPTYQVQYCSMADSTNQQNWPIYNISGIGITRFNASDIPYATLPVRAVNYLSRLSLVDVTGRDPLSELTALSVAGSVQWFGEDYILSNTSAYENSPSPLHTYSTKDSAYTSEILSGWLDVLAPTNGGTNLVDPYAKQALSLARTFSSYQMRPWAIVGSSTSVTSSLIGTVPKLSPVSNASQIPAGIPYFKSGQSANGILDTIEPRWYTLSSSLSVSGYQQVPFFLQNFTDQQSLSDYLYSAIQSSIDKLSKIQPVSSAVQALSQDIAAAQTLANLHGALDDTPYVGIYFDQIDHAKKNYSYSLQIGENGVLSNIQGFPTAGLRKLLQQSQLSNGILRMSDPKLAQTVITQGTRAFPYLEPGQVFFPFGSVIGRILYPLGISFLLPIFTLTLVKDKEARILAMLRMNGLGDASGYYISSFITFYISYVVSMFVFYVTGYLTRLELFTETAFSVLIIAILLWGFVQVSMAFFFNSLFKSSSVANVGVFLIVICGVVTSYILDQVFPDPATFPTVVMIWPPFAFYRVLGLLNRHATSNVLASYTLDMVIPGDQVFFGFILMSVEIVVVIILSIYLTQVIPDTFGRCRPWNYPITDIQNYMKKGGIVEEKVFQKFEPSEEVAEDEDDHVKAERNAIKERKYPSDTPLVMLGMKKTYENSFQKKEAVKGVSFYVENGEVFGLLGPNGAGKTTLISVLTGIYPPTAGEATIAGFDIYENPQLAFRSIGVCPQFDILWNDLSIEEHLFFYARLKGISPELENSAVRAALELVELLHLAKRLVKGLSGGEKRRVSIAISLVSDPKVVFLDEPTTGLDPDVRRSVWDTIAIARGNRAILLTTHSMEEAEVCCQKVGIMAKGHLKCLGTPSTLKQNYGCGYKLSITSHKMDKAHQFVMSILPEGSVCIHQFEQSRRYGFKPDAIQLANVFDLLVLHANDAGIENWGVSQTTLDEIFTTVITESDASGTSK
ncbi:hypothetical protein HDV01_002976 [Terramyces sp. JEL0728]|nr:hypothetical protein HDV01_002976 [Terramyces sp. JEL0728]